MEQKNLVSKISNVHCNLRRKRRENEGDNWDLIWKEHTEDLSCLKEYAEAMHKLATEIWDPRNSIEETESDKLKCRLDWVHSKCRDHYGLNVGVDRKLKLLDVGSCYNPFKKFRDFYDLTAIDLCPAPGMENEVLRCDFLQVKVSEDRDRGSEMEEGKLVSLPKGDFDIVVFSFFLEYLPDKKQRLESCRKAVELLRPGGLLFILRPDSNSVTPKGNSRLCKGLKVGNAFLGLKRIYFEKLVHLWCMGFQKLEEKEKEEYLGGLRFQKDLKKVKESFEFSEGDFEELFSIPQDFSFKDGDEFENSSESCCADKKVFDVETEPELFNELPGEDLDSDDG